jgi:hypothetical protein
MGMLRHRPHASNVAGSSCFIATKKGGGTLIFFFLFFFKQCDVHLVQDHGDYVF